MRERRALTNERNKERERTKKREKRRTDELTIDQTNERANERTNQSTNERTSEKRARTYERAEERTNDRTRRERQRSPGLTRDLPNGLLAISCGAGVRRVADRLPLRLRWKYPSGRIPPRWTPPPPRCLPRPFGTSRRSGRANVSAHIYDTIYS